MGVWGGGARRAVGGGLVWEGYAPHRIQARGRRERVRMKNEK